MQNCVPLVDIIFYEKALFVFNYEIKMQPDEISKYLTEASQVYERSTRASNQNNHYSSFKHVKSSEIYNIRTHWIRI